MTSNGHTPRFINAFGDIPAGFDILIYGAGGGGRFLADMLGTCRPDLRVRGFLDRDANEPVAGLPVDRPDALAAMDPQRTLVLIASAYWFDMEQRLKDLHWSNYAIVHSQMVSDAMLFRPEELAETERVAGFLHVDAERELYGQLALARGGCDCDMRRFRDIYLKRFHRTPPQYFEYLAIDAIRTVIEGGICDGTTSLQFLAVLPEQGRLYGFEPFYEAYAQSRLAAVMEEYPQLEILPVALWSKSGSLNLQPAEDGASSVTAAGGGRQVPAVTVDDFVAERKIGKVDLIKLDVEGAELEVLRGAENTLSEHRPQLAVCIYHHRRDMIDIPLFLDQQLEEYRYHLGHYSPTMLESVWYAIPKELK